MKLNQLTIRDKELFNRYLSLDQHELSVFAFENIYIWRALFDIEWAIIEDSLCIFFKSKTGCFLYLGPLAKSVKPKVIQEAFKIMDSLNRNKQVSRIENVEEKELTFYKGLGYECKRKSCDYICKGQDLVGLRGERFKTKRKSFNHFVKNYKFKYLPFLLEYKDECLRLYARWMKNRKAKYEDEAYRYMLEDTGKCLKVLFEDYNNLDLAGRVVMIDNKIKAFSFGFKLNKDIFCVLYEVADLSIKGLSQFIFREFCSDLNGYEYINIMDDSGLENLKRLKLSYHPVRLAPAYTVGRNISGKRVLGENP